MKESEIRDYLAAHLDVISDELILVQTEYKLKNDTGTDGFIDILARDIYDNYVIIEIKQSKQSSRQAIHEIIKYVTLLKRELHLKDSEIRVIIVSTVWEELYTPYWELKEKIDWAIEGYVFHSDKSCEMIRENAKEKSKRQLSRNQLVFLYSSEKDMEQCKIKLAKVIDENGLKDFFLLELRNKETPKVVFPFALVLVIQRCKDMDYISILIEKEWSEEELYEYDYKGEELSVFLEENIYKYIIDYHLFHDVEICYPEKLLSMIGQQGWKEVSVSKYGYFVNEKREDSWFFRKAIEINEGNIVSFSDFCDTKFELKFTEMLNNAKEFLVQKDDMLEKFSALWEIIEKDDLKRMYIDIYNAGNIIQNLIMYEINDEITELPYADLYLEYQNGEVERYILQLAYNDAELRPYCYVLDSLLYGNGLEYMYMLWSGEIVCFNSVIMKNFGLTYDWLKYSYGDSGWKLQRNYKKKKFISFYRNHRGEIMKMKQWYLSHVLDQIGENPPL